MNIGAAAAASGVSAKMIRYYEAQGLMPAAARSEAGYRIYSQADVHTLRFFRRARDLGFAVAEIRELLQLWQDRSRQSADVKRLAQSHLSNLQQRMAALQGMAASLENLLHCCAGNERPDCPILAELGGVEPPSASRIRE